MMNAYSADTPHPAPLVRTLLADDSESSRDTLRDLVTGLNAIEVVAAVPDGREAVRAYRELRPELVVLDVHMPNLNGVLASAEIRSLSSVVRIVLVSFDPGITAKVAAMASGADAFISKLRIHRELRPAIVRMFPHCTTLGSGAA